jgi:tRNA(fMet)-specific endonuclease VapC
LQFEIVAFDAQAAMHAASIRALLEKAGMPIGAYDTLIVGQALALGLILITHNTREFRRVANLTIEDWQS